MTAGGSSSQKLAVTMVTGPNHIGIHLLKHQRRRKLLYHTFYLNKRKLTEVVWGSYYLFLVIAFLLPPLPRVILVRHE